MIRRKKAPRLLAPLLTLLITLPTGVAGGVALLAAVIAQVRPDGVTSAVCPASGALDGAGTGAAGASAGSGANGRDAAGADAVSASPVPAGVGGGIAGAGAVGAARVPAAAGAGAAGAAGTGVAAAAGAGRFVSEDGRVVELDARHAQRAGEMVAEARAAGADDHAVLIVLMAAFQESGFRNYSNIASYPQSAEMTDDGDGHDEDSLGVLQQRPVMGWGEVAELMNPRYAVRAFLGGPSGPNHGNPPGLFDIHGWRAMEPGQAAQAVQFSAHPELYETWHGAAERLLRELGAASPCPAGSPPMPGEAAYPLPETVPITDGIGPRPCEQPLASGGCAHSTWHPALDFGAPCGMPVLAVRPGTVIAAANAALFIQADDGAVIKYLHMPSASYLVSIGDVVRAGQRIGEVGNEGPSTGCHLDLRIDTALASEPAVRALPRIGEGAAGIAPGHWADPAAYLSLYGIDLMIGGTT